MKNHVKKTEKYVKRISKRKITRTSSILMFCMLGISKLSLATDWNLTEDEKKYKTGNINNYIGEPSNKLTGVSVNTAGEQYAYKIENGLVVIKVENNEVSIDKGKKFKIGEDTHTYSSGTYYKVKTLDAFMKLKELTKTLPNGEHTFNSDQSNEIIKLNKLGDNYTNANNLTALGENSVAIGNGAQARANSVVAIGNRAGLTDKLNKYAYKYSGYYDSEFAQGYNAIFIGDRAGYLANTFPTKSLTGTIMIGARTGVESEGDGNIYFGSDSGRKAIGSQNMYFGDSAKASHKIPDDELKYKNESRNDIDAKNYKKYEKYYIGPNYNYDYKSYGNRNLVFSNNFVIEEELEKENRYKGKDNKHYIKEGNDFYEATVNEWAEEREVKNQQAIKDLQAEYDKNKNKNTDKNHITFKGYKYLKSDGKFYITKEKWTKKGEKITDLEIIKGLKKDKPYVSDTIALGTFARALDDQAIAIGGSKQNYVPGAVAAGKRSIAIGMSKQVEEIGALADADDSVAIGTNSKALNEGSLGIGAYSKAAGENTTAVGFKAQALKENAISYGVEATSSGKNAIAIGTKANSIGENAIVLGIGSSTKDSSEFENGTATGMWHIPENKLSKDLSAKDKTEISSIQISEEDKKKFTGTGIILLGNNINEYTFTDNSVIIGNDASGVVTIGGKTYGASTPVKTVDSAEISLPNGLKIKYGGFAGQVKDDGQYVSFGKVGQERQLKNVAPGEISSKSTDAVNGSQLNSLFVDLKKDITANTPYEYQDDKGNVLNLVKGLDGKLYDKSINDAVWDDTKNKYKTKDDKEIAPVKNVKVVTKGNDSLALSNVKSNLVDIDGNNGGNVEVTKNDKNIITSAKAPNNIDNIKNNAATVSDVLNSGFNLQGNGSAVDFVKAYDTVNFVNGEGTTVSVESKDGLTSTIKINVNKGSIVTSDEGVAEIDLSKELQEVNALVDKLTKEIGTVEESKKAGVQKQLAEANALKDKLDNKEKARDAAKVALSNAKKALADAETNLLANKDEQKKDELSKKVDEAKEKLNEAEEALKTANDEIGKDKVATVNDVVNTVNNSSFNVTSGKDGSGEVVGTNPEKVKAGDTITLKAGDNLKLVQDGKNFTYSLKDEVTLTKDGTTTKIDGDGITITPKKEDGTSTNTTISLTKDGLNNGGKKITHVAEGTELTDAVNLGQLNNVKNTLNQTIDNSPFEYAKEDGTSVVKGLDGEYYTPESIKDKVYVDKEITKADGTKTTYKGYYSSSDVTNGIPKDDATKAEAINPKVDKVVIKAKGKDTQTISNVKSNLPITNATGHVLDGVTKEGDPIYVFGDEKYVKKDDGFFKLKEDGSLENTKLDDATTLEKLKEKLGIQVTKPTQDELNKIVNNATTVGDVLNTGFNLQGNGKAKDFVKAYDTVNFVNGDGTTVSVESKDGLTSTIKINVNKGSIVTSAEGVAEIDLSKELKEATDLVTNLTEKIKTATDGEKDQLQKQLTEANALKDKLDNKEKARDAAKVALSNAKKALADAETNLLANKDEQKKDELSKKVDEAKEKLNEAEEALKTANDNIAKEALNKVATVNDVVNTVNNSSFNVTSGQVGSGEVSGTSSEKVKAGDTITLKAGDNLKLVQDGKNFTYSLKDEVTLTKTIETKGNGNTPKKTEVVTTKLNAEGFTIKTGTKKEADDGLDNENTISLTKDGLNNGGKKITHVAEGTELTDAVNLGQLNNVKNTLNQTIDNSPFEYAKEDGTSVVKGLDGEYYTPESIKDKVYVDKLGYFSPDDLENGQPKAGKEKIKAINPKVEKVVIKAKGTTPQTISNVKSNLAVSDDKGMVTENGQSQLVTKPKEEDLKKIKNNSATVEDVLSTGFNLQGNGEAKDFVKAYDTLNFVDGKGTQVVVESDGTKSTIQVNVDQGKIETHEGRANIGGLSTTVNKDKEIEKKQAVLNAKKERVDANAALEKAKLDNPTAISQAEIALKAAEEKLSQAEKEYAQIQADNHMAKLIQSKKELIDAQAELEKATLDNEFHPSEEMKKKLKEAEDKLKTKTEQLATAQQSVDNNPLIQKEKSKVATVGDVVDALNNTYWKIDSKGVDGGESTYKSNGNSVMRSGETLNVHAGQNIRIKGAGKTLIVETKDEVEFKTVTLKGQNGQAIVNGDGITITPKAGSTISLTSKGLDNGGNKITHVAAGTDPTDVVNVGQLKQAQTNIDNRLNKLSKDAKAGTAAAMAVGNLPQVTLPGKSLATVGVGTYNNQSAIAAGVSRMSDNGKWIIKFSGSYDSQKKAGGAAAVGYQW